MTTYTYGIAKRNDYYGGYLVDLYTAEYQRGELTGATDGCERMNDRLLVQDYFRPLVFATRELAEAWIVKNGYTVSRTEALYMFLSTEIKFIGVEA